MPGAELAASFHVEVTAPPGVSILHAGIVAGLPNLRFDDDPKRDRKRWTQWREAAEAAGDLRARRLRRRPSFDLVSGGYPTVDLHITEVPYGSLSRAQVELQANPTGWLATAWLAAWLATLMLGVAFAGEPEKGDLATTVLITFAAAMVAVLVRPDPHEMVTRLLSGLRLLAAGSAVLTLAGALALAFLEPQVAHWWLLGLGAASILPTLMLTWAWWLARRRLIRLRGPGDSVRIRRRPKPLAQEDPETDPSSWRAAWSRLRAERRADPRIRVSPWEQLLPDQRLDARADRDFHVDLAAPLEQADYPYDLAVKELGFRRSGIKIDSSEGVRDRFFWDQAFRDDFNGLLDGGTGPTTSGPR